MNNGQLPKLTANPLSARERLAKAQDWTEQPAKEVAQAVTAPVPAKAAEMPKKPAEQVEEGVTSMTTRFPTSLAKQIRFAAGSTYGVTVNSFVVDAVREKLNNKR